jgi:2-dehydro-3-deoxyphosphooctonate aldolase (KDO 8-P synthase)
LSRADALSSARLFKSLRGAKRLFLIAGPCVIESPTHPARVAGRLVEIAGALGIPFVFKASYDKANRSSAGSYRGLGMERGLDILAAVRDRFRVPVLTDVHDVSQVEKVAAAAVRDWIRKNRSELAKPV